MTSARSQSSRSPARHGLSKRRSNRLSIALAGLAAAGLGVGIGLAGGFSTQPATKAAAGATSTPSVETSTSGLPDGLVAGPPPVVLEPEPEPLAGPATFTILGAGDVLPHMPVNASARTSDGYDFSPLLAGLDDWVSGADLALCHFEVPVAPPGSALSGYPMFGATPQLVADLQDQGWDGCSTASNHSVDRGFAGIESTIRTFDKLGMGHAGTSRKKRAADEPQLYVLHREGQDITVAHFSVAYGTNGLPLPAGKPWSVNLLDPQAVIANAHEAREDGADLVVVSVHAGTEYRTEPIPEQINFDQALADSGEVDLIIGHHAHVPQPIAHLDGGPDGTGVWVAYGLGNMISNQDSACCVPATDSGALIIATVTKPVDGPARVTGVEWEGITVDRHGKHRVYAFSDVLKDKKGVGTLSHAALVTRHDRVAAAVGDAAPEATHPPEPTGPAPEVLKRH